MTRLGVLAVVASALGSVALAGSSPPSGLGVTPVLLGGVLGSLVLILAPGLAIAGMLEARSSLDTPELLVVTLVGTGTAAMLLFWAFAWSPWLGTVAAATVLLLGVTGWAITVGGTKQLLPTLALAGMVALTASAFAFTAGGLESSDRAIALRYWEAPDNRIPGLVSERLLSGTSLSETNIISDWQTSDRPPLQSGAVVALLPFFRDQWVGYQLASTALQSLWIVAVVALLLRAGSDRRSAYRTVLLVSCTGVMYLNTVYVWPKLLAGAFGIAAATVLLRSRHLWLALSALTLGLLAHGGTMFVVPALGVLAWRQRHNWNRTAFLAAIGASAVLFLPWVGFQRLADPPGDRLLRWHLAADIAVVGDDVISSVIDSYRVPPARVLANKARNVFVLVGFQGAGPQTKALVSGPERLASWMRGEEGGHLLWAPALLLVGLAGVRRRPEARPFLLLAVGTTACSVLLEHGGIRQATTIVPHLSYVGVMSWVTAAAIGTLALPRRWRQVVVALQVAVGAAVWLVAPKSIDTARFSPSALAVAVIGAGAIYLLVSRPVASGRGPGGADDGVALLPNPGFGDRRVAPFDESCAERRPRTEVAAQVLHTYASSPSHVARPDVGDA